MKNKYNIGDKVWFIEQFTTVVVEHTVRGIILNRINNWIEYSFEESPLRMYTRWYKESLLFPTKEELLKSL